MLAVVGVVLAVAPGGLVSGEVVVVRKPLEDVLDQVVLLVVL